MTKRQEKILFWIVEEFIKTSIPVSSTNLQRETSIDCCSSTVRNEMIVLEKLEMIEKLHSASGRVPTTKGYRYYLENSKQDKKFAGLKFSIDEIFKNRAASIESVVEQACYLISDVLQLPIAIFKNTSHNETKKLQAIQLIKLQDKKCMLILIANNDVLVEKIITLENDLIIDLQLSVDIISKRLFNSPLSEIKNRLDSLIPLLVKSIGSFEGKLKSLVIEVFKRALMSVNVYGTSNMLTTPELSDPSILQSIVSLLDKKNIWKLLSNEFLPLESREGTELGFMKNNELSVVSVGMKENLTLAIVGPKRVDYTKILNALDLVKSNLEENKRLLSTQRVNIEDKNSEVHNG